MSLAVSHLPSTPVLLPRHGNETHGPSDHSKPAAIPHFYCTPKSGTPSAHNLPTCASIPLTPCLATNGTLITLTSRSVCTDLCAAVEKDSFVEDYLGCFEAECGDAEKHEHHNHELLEELKEGISAGCKGLKGNETVKGEPKGEEDSAAGVMGVRRALVWAGVVGLVVGGLMM